MDPERGEHKAGLPGPSVWPIGVAVGVVCILVGLIVSWWIVGIGAAVTFVFGFLWIYELSGSEAHGAEFDEPPEPSPASPGTPAARPLDGPQTSRKGFLAATTLGLGAVIGGLVTIPPLFLALIPPFLKQGYKDIDLGKVRDFPENQWVIATFMLNPSQGLVTRHTAYVRYNGFTKDPTSGKPVPSFSIISNRCAHLGCPVQPGGLIQDNERQVKRTSGGEVVTTIPVAGVSSFACPCHGGAYDSEGNRTAGPPVRALDRFNFSIKNGRLFLGSMFGVSHVENTGADAQIHAYKLYGPGQHVDGVEQILYPFTPPS